MTYPATSGPPPGPRPPGGPSAPQGRAGTPVWWVVAAVAVVVSVALVAWLVLTGSPGAEPSGSASPTTSVPSSSLPVSSTPETPPGDNWGDFPPKNLDSAKDLSDPQFPEKIGAFALESRTADASSVVAKYEDRVNFTGVTAFLVFSTHTYPDDVKDLTDVGYFGRAVCGHLMDFPDQVKCLMVGTSEVLSLSSADGLSLEAVGALTEELYDAL